jgi:uroporphyrinogen-III decarboxylase
MNSRERMAIAMQGGQPDRVPVMCQLALGHYFLNSSLSPHKIWFTSEGFAEALVKMRERYRFDGVLINLPGRPENCLEDIHVLSETPDGQQLTWSNGDVILLPWDDNPFYISTGGGRPLHPEFDSFGIDDLDSLDDYSGYTWGTYHIPHLAGKTIPGPLAEIPDYFFRTIDLVLEQAAGEYAVHGEVFSPFTHFMELFGYEVALMGLVMDEEKAHALLDVFTNSVILWAVAQTKRGVDALLISSAFAGGPFLSRKMYADFVLPYEARVVEAVKQAGGIVYTHTCGKIGDRLDLMEATGTMGVDTLDPPPLGSVELAQAKSEIGDRLFIKGNMNSVALLKYQDRDQILEHARERITQGKAGGGYILSTACSVAPRVEPWKLELLVPLAEQLGRYTE